MNGDLDATLLKASSMRRDRYVLTVRMKVRVGAAGGCEADKNDCLMQCARRGEGRDCEQTCMRKWRDCTGIRM